MRGWSLGRVISGRMLRLWMMVALLGMASMSFAQDGGAPAWLAEVKSQAAEAMKAQTLPSVSVAVWNDSRVEAFALGWADVEQKVPATPESLYRLASISKPITAVAVMRLAQSYRLGLDARAELYCPAFAGHPEVTARMLLGHRSGVHHYKSDDSAQNTHHFATMDDAVRNFAADPLEFPAGRHQLYTSYGFTVLGCEVAGASGTDYAHYVERKVLHPLHMKQTIVDDESVPQPGRVQFYTVKNGKLAAAHALDISDRLPGGGWLSTPTEMVEFASGVEHLLGPEWTRLMWRETSRPGENLRYALGWELGSVEGEFMVAHGGSQAGTSTFLMLLPKRKVAVAVFTNRDGADVRAVAKKMAETVLGPARPGNAEPKKKPAKKDSVRYASVASRTAGTR